ncbi:MAG: amidohydrolase/deacetylase family metallohydrolase [Acidobacteriota bacterium]
MSSKRGFLWIGFCLLCIVLPFAFSQPAAPRYDLLLQGGHVIDPRNGLDAVLDVGITGGRIAAVARGLSPSQATQVVRVDGMYVTPGLVDIHTHLFHGTAPDSYLSNGLSAVAPDGFTFRSGVTTAVDAGGAGWRNFRQFKVQVIDVARTRVLALINVVGAGMRGGPFEQDLDDMNSQLTAQRAREYKDVIVGIKTAHYRGAEWDPVDRAVEAGRLAGVPIMVDFGEFIPERPFQDLVGKHLRPGDMYTHAYRDKVPFVDAEGKLLPYLLEARRRGVLFDVGHGGGSFLFRQAVPAMRAGFAPDSISTDLHTGSMNGGMKDMLNVMSKFLNMGMSLQDAILKSTWAPARQIQRAELGHLSVGAVADVAVLALRNGNFGFVDVGGGRLTGTQKLECELTLRDGRVVWDLNGISRLAWDKQ